MADTKKAELKAADKEAQAKSAALEAAVTQIEKDFGQGSVMRLGDKASVPVETIPTGALSLDLALGVGGVPRGRIVEIFGPESSGKTTLVYHIIAEAQAPRRGLRLRRRRARDRPDLREADRRRHRRAAGLAARLRRAGARDRRRAGPLGRRRRGRGRLGRRAHPAGRARGPDGRAAGRPAGADDVAGDAQARRQPQPGEDRLPVHEPDPGEDRGHVRLAGDPAGRPGAEVLLLAAARHAPDRDPQGGHRGGRQPGPGEGGQEQGRGAVPPGRVRHRVRRSGSRTRAACSTSALEHDLVQKSGSFFSYGELRLGQGRNNTKQYLHENPRPRRRDRGEAVRASSGSSGRRRPPRAVPDAEDAEGAETGEGAEQAAEAAAEPERKAA